MKILFCAYLMEIFGKKIVNNVQSVHFLSIRSTIINQKKERKK